MPILRPSVNGMFPMIIPNPIGTRRRGSQSFSMATVMKVMPITIIIRCCHVMLAKPVYCRNCCRLSITVFMLSECYDCCSFKYRVSLCCIDSSHYAVKLGLDLILHLHGLEDSNHLTGLDCISDIDIDRKDHSWKR